MFAAECERLAQYCTHSLSAGPKSACESCSGCRPLCRTLCQRRYHKLFYRLWYIRSPFFKRWRWRVDMLRHQRVPISIDEGGLSGKHLIGDDAKAVDI